MRLAVPNTDIRVSGVFYRDRSDHRPLEILRFTRNVRAFGHAMRRIRASGGGDYPEDMDAGLNLAMRSLDWRRGSFIAGWGISHFFADLVEMPGSVVKATKDLLRASPGLKALSSVEDIPSSVHNMTPDHPFIRSLASMPVDPSIQAHSIIAVKGDGPIEGGSDGVVKYSSAHIDGVESELVVRSGHSSQSHPNTVAEVARILKLHAAENPCHEAGQSP